MNIFLWIVFGAVAGWLAGLIMGNRQGLLGNILVGILGSAVGGFVATRLGIGSVTGFNLVSLLIAVGGACLLLLLFGLLKKNAK